MLAACEGNGRGMQVVGRENLPANDEPAVYVANHQSFLVSAQPMPCLHMLLTRASPLVLLAVISHFIIRH